MVAFSADTDFVLTASVSAATKKYSGSIYRVQQQQQAEGQETATTATTTVPAALKFGAGSQEITTVDWTNSSNACLLGTIDGSVKVTTLIKV